MQNKIGSLLLENGFNIFGFCRFCDVLPLLNVRSASRLPKEAKSVITMLFPYNIGFSGERNLSLYCLGKDYHDIIIKKIKALCEILKSAFPDNEFEGFCDISPIKEVRAAYLSGLGFLGKNGLIIHPKYGSYCFIGEIVTDLEFNKYSSPLGYCLNCGLCLKSCIGGALSRDESGYKFSLDTEKCLSAVTQKKGELTENQESLIRLGGLVWGCDKCSEVCPMNKKAEKTDIEEFYNSPLPILTEENIDESKDRAYGYKGKKILLRNICIINENFDKNKSK